jgi:hypothetical protein
VKRVITYSLAIVLIASGISVVVDLYKNSQIEIIHRIKPKYNTQGDISNVLKQFIVGDKRYNQQWLHNTLDYIDHRYINSDFKYASLIRVLYLYSDLLSQEDLARTKKTVLGFKYWMTHPGLDSMCYWSENHQILYATGEYLSGQLYPDDVFTNTAMTGRQHKAEAKARVLTWLEQRWLYGFTEWYSNTYYKEDIAPLANLVDFSEDEEVRIKAAMILDLLVYDMASQSYKGSFNSSSGRGYATKKMSGRFNSMNATVEHLFGFDVYANEHGSSSMDINFIHSKSYVMPPVLYDIAHDPKPRVIKATQGLNLDELVERNLVGQRDEQIMMQWAMESFTSHQVIANSIEYIDNNNMFVNSDLHPFTDVNFTLLRNSGLMPSISRFLNPQFNGTSIQRANTYTYRTPHYMMSSAQKYQPGDYGDQHHVFGVTLSNDLSIFHNHPAVEEGKKGASGKTPSYWVGYGYLPHSMQDENVNLSIYKAPEKKSIMAKPIIEYTHAYFPKQFFDEVVVERRFAFGKIQDAYVAMIAANDLHYRIYQQDDKRTVDPEQLWGSYNGTDRQLDYDLIQPGTNSFWITEISDLESDGSFQQFMHRIRQQAQSIRFDGERLHYNTVDTQRSEKALSLTFAGDFIVNGQVIDPEHPRYDAPYIQAERYADELTFDFNGKQLYLNFQTLERRWATR